jgi:hypothetical protein
MSRTGHPRESSSRCQGCDSETVCLTDRFIIVRQHAAIAATAIAILVSACSGTERSSAEATQTPFPSGLTPTCTDRYASSWSEGPLENGKYLHFLCRNGKVTSWWVDDNNGTEDAPPG